MLQNAKIAQDDMEKLKKQSRVLTKQVDYFENFVYGSKRKSLSPRSPPLKEKHGAVSPAATTTVKPVTPLKKMGTMFIRKGTKMMK